MRYFTFIILLSLTLNGLTQQFEWASVKSHDGLSRDDGVAFAIDDAVYYGSGNHGGFL